MRTRLLVQVEKFSKCVWFSGSCFACIACAGCEIFVMLTLDGRCSSQSAHKIRKLTTSTPTMYLSQPSTKISSYYDVIVIGSGYGGSVAACRLSRSGKRVAVFEKAWSTKPRISPRGFHRPLKNLHVTTTMSPLALPRLPSGILPLPRTLR